MYKDKDDAMKSIELLRRLGNSRLPYIVATLDNLSTANIAEYFAIEGLAFKHIDASSLDYNGLADALLNADSNIVALSNCRQWQLLIANEVLGAKPAGFNWLDDEHTASIRLSISCTDFVAYQATSLFHDAKPWENLIVHTASGAYAKVFWDTREIVQAGVLSQPSIDKLASQGKQINDNSRYLFNLQDLILPNPIDNVCITF